MKVYEFFIVSELKAFYGHLLTDIEKHASIKDHLTVVAQRMFQGMKEQNEAVWSQVNNYNPLHLGKGKEELRKLSWNLEDAQHTVANEHGFKNWEKIPDIPYNLLFEQAVNALLKGDLTTLKKLIQKDASLLSARSLYGHKATLLHYCGSNGVELWRQKVPYNLPEIVQYLLDEGADETAKMNVYGGEFTTLQLLQTSAHPKAAGLLDQLVPLFKDR